MQKYLKNYISIISLLLLMASFVISIVSAFSAIDDFNSFIDGYTHAHDIISYAPQIKYLNTLKSVSIITIVVNFVAIFLSILFINSVTKKTLSYSKAFPFLLMLKTIMSIVCSFINISASSTFASDTGTASTFKVPESSVITIVFMFIIFFFSFITIVLMKHQDNKERAILPLVLSYTLWLGIEIFNFSQIGTYTPAIKANFAFDIIVSFTVILVGLFDYSSNYFQPEN